MLSYEALSDALLAFNLARDWANDLYREKVLPVDVRDKIILALGTVKGYTLVAWHRAKPGPVDAPVEEEFSEEFKIDE